MRATLSLNLLLLQSFLQQQLASTNNGAPTGFDIASWVGVVVAIASAILVPYVGFIRKNTKFQTEKNLADREMIEKLGQMREMLKDSSAEIHAIIEKSEADVKMILEKIDSRVLQEEKTLTEHLREWEGYKRDISRIQKDLDGMINREERRRDRLEDENIEKEKKSGKSRDALGSSPPS